MGAGRCWGSPEPAQAAAQTADVKTPSGGLVQAAPAAGLPADTLPSPPPALSIPVPAVAWPLPTPEPALPTPRLAATEQAYATALNRLVDGLKRYPTSREARTLRPQGTVQVWLEVDRSGLLLQAGLAASSGAPLLDAEALRSLRVGRYAPFPPGAFEGQPSRRFLIAIEYRNEGG
jgi:protein TonB